MICTISLDNSTFQVNLSQPLDISIPLQEGTENVNAWYVDPMRIKPVQNGDWIGDVKQGGSVNFRNISFNPHGNGTHTECVGHISKEIYSINQCLKKFFFLAELISISPEKRSNGDQVITGQQIQEQLGAKTPQALIIRTLPNHSEKIVRQYSNSNPPYIEAEAARFIHQKNIEHLLIDLPSVDKEVDDGQLAAHHLFWQYPENPLLHRTITELVYMDNTILDGSYLLNLQIASFENDASPSKPVLYKII
jgi:arylformamidase